MGLPFPEIPSSISLKLSSASCLQEAEPSSCSDMIFFLCWTRPGPWTMLGGGGLSLQNNFHNWWLGLQSHETALTSPGVIWLANLLAPFGKWPGSIWPIRLFPFYSTFQLRHRMLTNTDAVGVFFCFFFLIAFSKICVEGKIVPISHSSHATWEHIFQTLFPHDHKNVYGMTFFEKIKRLVPCPVPGNGSMFAKIKGVPLLMSSSIGVWGSVYLTGVFVKSHSYLFIHSLHQTYAGQL